MKSFKYNKVPKLLIRYVVLLQGIFIFSCLLRTEEKVPQDFTAHYGVYHKLHSTNGDVGMFSGDAILSLNADNTGSFVRYSPEDTCDIFESRFVWELFRSNLIWTNQAVYEKYECETPLSFSDSIGDFIMGVHAWNESSLVLINHFDPDTLYLEKQ